MQCLEGKVEFRFGELTRELTAGTFLYLEGSGEHSLRASEDSSLLVTILLPAHACPEELARMLAAQVARRTEHALLIRHEESGH